MASLTGQILLFYIGLVMGLAKSTNSEDCPFNCSLSKDQELFCAEGQNKNFEASISCQKDLINERFILGNRSSIRRIIPNGLKVLSKFDSGGKLNIFLNINILELTASSFAGLEDVLSNLKVLHVNTIHPDTLYKHRKIVSLTFDSDRTPQLPDDIKKKVNIPTFLRLQPQDPSMPIEVNMEIRCHKCAGEKPFHESTILTFSLLDFDKSGGTLDSLTMVYMDNCPTLIDALGCPKNGSSNDFIVRVNASNGWRVTVEEFEESDLTTDKEGAHMKPLLLSVIIWCTILTILLGCLIATLVIRRRNRTKKLVEERRNALQRRYSVPSLKHIICGTTSCEELHRASLSNGGTWIYGTPSQNSCSNLLSETRSQFSIRPPFPNLGYPHPHEGMYSNELQSDYRASIFDFIDTIPQHKSSGTNSEILLVNEDSGLPPLPASLGFQVSGTPSYKRSHDGTFKMVQ